MGTQLYQQDASISRLVLIHSLDTHSIIAPRPSFSKSEHVLLENNKVVIAAVATSHLSSFRLHLDLHTKSKTSKFPADSKSFICNKSFLKMAPRISEEYCRLTQEYGDERSSNTLHNDKDQPLLISPDGGSLSISTGTDDKLEIHSIIPDGIAIGEGSFGRCLVTTKSFPKGSLLYRGFGAVLPTNPDETEFRLCLYKNSSCTTPCETLIQDSVNSVKDHHQDSSSDTSGPRRQLFGFDGFLNHSCDPNIYAPLVYRTADWICFDTIALKDIAAGQEIKCDYACFDYDCDGHQIPACGCGAPKCRGFMMGFAGLDLVEQTRILHMCEPEIVTKFLQDNQDIAIVSEDDLCCREPCFLKDTCCTYILKRSDGTHILLDDSSICARDMNNATKEPVSRPAAA